jgi:hypothetical protein
MARLRELAGEGRLGCRLPVLAESYVHIFLNRLFRSENRVHELVIYDYLAQLYARRIARAKYKTTQA